MTNASKPQAIAAADLPGLVGSELGISEWFQLDQERIDRFADVTEDHQFIHVDPERASQTDFGGTVAHGSLSLSMLSAMAAQGIPQIENTAVGLNYGFDKVRFLAPVPSGARIRGRFTLEDASEKGPGRWLLRYGVTVEIEDSDKPALIAQWLVMIILG